MSEKIDGWEVSALRGERDNIGVIAEPDGIVIDYGECWGDSRVKLTLAVLRKLLAEHQLHIVSEADMAVLKAVEMIPDGTLVGILTGTLIRMTGSVINTIEVESARRDAQKAGGA